VRFAACTSLSPPFLLSILADFLPTLAGGGSFDVRLETEVSAIERATRFVDPANRYFARYASPWRRAAAATVDWALCLLLWVLVSIPLGMVQELGQVSWEARDLGGTPGHILVLVAQVLTLVPVVAYWALLLPTSQTFGMRLTGLRVVSTTTGRGISYVRAVVRSLVTTGLAIAVYIVLLVTTSFDKDQELDDTSTKVLDVSYALAAIAALSALTMILMRRSLVDRVFGTAVVDELEAIDPHMGPWGPIDAFDTSR
jgi:uncharacterized RDD family membrane protein YckC